MLEIDITGFIGFWETSKETIIRRVRAADPDLIRVFIASPGGFVDDGLALHDFLKGYEASVEVSISGMTASAATIIAMAGDVVRMSDNALFLVHHASGIALGKSTDMDQYAGWLRKIDGRIINIYAKRTGRDEDEIDDLMADEEWLTPDETLEWGFVDEIYEPAVEEETAAAPLRAVAYMPTPSVLDALGLPPIPTTQTKATAMADKKNSKTTAEQKADAEAKAAEEKKAADEAGKAAEKRSDPPEQPDERDKLARMEARMKQLEAENEQLAQERKQTAIDGLKEKLTGRVPGKAVDELVDLASEQETDFIQKMTKAVDSIPQMVDAGRIAVPEQDADVVEARKQAVKKM